MESAFTTTLFVPVFVAIKACLAGVPGGLLYLFRESSVPFPAGRVQFRTEGGDHATR